MRPKDAKAQLTEEGYCVIPDVLKPHEVAYARSRLWAAAEESERRGAATRNVGLDPNEHNVRVFNLVELDPLFSISSSTQWGSIW